MNQPPTPEPKLSLQTIEAKLKTTHSIVASPCAQSSTHLERLLLSNPYIREAHGMSYMHDSLLPNLTSQDWLK